MKLAATIVLALAMAGCAKATAIPISQNMVQITSDAAPVCGASGAQRVAGRQAAMETIRRGYDRFVIIDARASNNIQVVGHTPVIAHTTGTATGMRTGNMVTAHGSATTTYSGGQPIVGGSHQQGLIVRMFKDGESGSEQAISARQELGPDWRKVASGGTLTCFD